MGLSDLYYHYEGATSFWGAVTSLARGRLACVSLVSPSRYCHLPTSKPSNATGLGCRDTEDDCHRYVWREGILVNVTRKITPNSNSAKLENQLCWLKPTIVSYDLMVNGGNATFVSNSWKGDSVIKPVHPKTSCANVFHSFQLTSPLI